MFQKLSKALGLDPNKREVDRLSQVIAQVNVLEAEYEKLSDEALRAKTEEFRKRIANEFEGVEDEKDRRRIEKEELNDLLPEAFAAVREASKRTLGLRHLMFSSLAVQFCMKEKLPKCAPAKGKHWSPPCRST